MKKLFLGLVLINLSGQSCSQGVSDKILGSWALDSGTEFPDIIIFRSDHRYLVYNPNSADVGPIEPNRIPKPNNIKINGAQTARTEEGKWQYDSSREELILSDRSILETWTDFSDAYSKSAVLRFKLKDLTENRLLLCFNNQRFTQCDTYKRNWSYIKDDGSKVIYREIVERFSGQGEVSKSFQLSGYETKLKASIRSNASAGLIVRNEIGLVLLPLKQQKGMDADFEYELRGCTILIIEVKSNQIDSNWDVTLEIM